MGENIIKALNNKGELLSIDNLKEGLEGLLLTREGVYLWQDNEIIKKILKLDDEITDEELNEIKGEYIRAVSLESYLYQEFLKEKFKDGKLDDFMTIIEKDFIDESLLHIQGKMINKIWTYDFKISLDVNGNVVITEDMFEDKEECDRQFGMGEYGSKISDLEAYEREKYGK